MCPGCGSYASEYDLEPRFGNIVTHERMTEGCAESAERVEVVEAEGEGDRERLEYLLSVKQGELDRARKTFRIVRESISANTRRYRTALEEIETLTTVNSSAIGMRCHSIARAALASGPPGGEGEE